MWNSIVRRIGIAVAIVWSLYQLYIAFTGFPDQLVLLPAHLSFALFLTFIFTRGRKVSEPNRVPLVDVFLALATAAAGIYFVVNAPRYVVRIPVVDPITPADYAFGLLLLVLLLEACRRAIGLALAVLAIIFIAYGFLGRYLPGVLAHRGLDLETFVEMQFLTHNGLYGLPLAVSAQVVFYFILFGVFLQKSGGGELFSDIAYLVTGRLRGGAAKAAVVSSALFGNISGSAVANVVVDGMLTIPLMKKTGFKPHVAAAFEAAASSGGQIMPPVMGAAAFILAQIIGVPYVEVALAAAIPALLYYVGLFAVAELLARQAGLRPVPREELPDIRDFLQRFHLLIPLVLLVFWILNNTALVTAAFRVTIIVVLISLVRKATRMGVRAVLAALEQGARETVIVALPTATAGVIIGIVVYSGIGLKFTTLLVDLAQNQLLVALVLVMLSSIILGMGMPTSAAYLMVAVLMGPAMIRMGVEPLPAHMFIFYFAVMSAITPPVALAAYAAAAIGNTDVWKTGLAAFTLALSGFLVPYAFVYNNALLLQGEPLEILWTTLSTIIGIVALSGTVVGFFARPTLIWERVLLGLSAGLLIVPEKVTDFVGLALLIGIVALQLRRPLALPQPVRPESDLGATWTSTAGAVPSPGKDA